MSLEAARQAITAEILRAKTAWDAANADDLQIDWPNRQTVNLSAQVKPYLAVDIEFVSGKQMSLGAQGPLMFDYGTIALAAGVKVGSGVSQLTKMLEFFRPYLQLRDALGGARTKEASISKGAPAANGFFYVPMTVPFWIESTAPAVPA